MRLFHKGISRLCAIIIGLVFFVAGLLKLQDPVGSGLVVKEYLSFFHLDALSGASLYLGIVLALVEALLGAALMAGIRRRTVAVFTMILTAFYTIITILLVIFQPVMDCGCFGEAIHLTHEQTLLKNLILCLLCLIAFIPAKKMEDVKNSRKNLAFILVALVLVGFTAWSCLLPMIDFTDYSAGAQLRSSYDSSLYSGIYHTYVKDGHEGVFEDGHLPDSTWTYVRTEEKTLGREVYDDSVVDLPVIDSEGEYRDELLSRGNVAVVSVYDPSKLGTAQWISISQSLSDAEAAGFTPFLLLPDAALAPVETSEFAYSADRKTLMTLNRSNGGATWIHNGGIVSKWARLKLPDYGEWTELLGENPTERMLGFSRRGRIVFDAVSAYSVALLLLL